MTCIYIYIFVLIIEKIIFQRNRYIYYLQQRTAWKNSIVSLLRSNNKTSANKIENRREDREVFKARTIVVRGGKWDK